MKMIITYLQSFLNRSGGYIFSATIFARLFSFLTSWVALQLIPNKALGSVLYAWNIITFLIPLIGAGLHLSYIRYGALTTNTKDREQLLYYILKYGILVSVLITVIIFFTGIYAPFDIIGSGIYLSAFSFVLLPMFLVEVIKIKLRLHHKNKKLAITEIVYTLLLFCFTVLLSYFFAEKGYITAVVLAPICTVAIFFREIISGFKKQSKPKVITLAFWKFGIIGSLSNVATIFLFAIDILLIGQLLKVPELITSYRYISLIPFSMLFLPRVFITTDFVSFTEKINTTSYIKSYIKSYLLLFTLISLVFILFTYLFSFQILTFLDPMFTEYTDSFLILNMGVCGILIFRGLFGNLLSSIGLVNINLMITIIAVLLNYSSNYQLIPILGLKGACITSAIVMWFTGIASAISFVIGYKKYLLTLKKT